GRATRVALALGAQTAVVGRRPCRTPCARSVALRRAHRPQTWSCAARAHTLDRQRQSSGAYAPIIPSYVPTALRRPPNPPTHCPHADGYNQVAFVPTEPSFIGRARPSAW